MFKITRWPNISASRKNNDKNVVVEFGGNDEELVRKPKKLKGQKSAKSGKKLLKSGNLPKFDVKKAGSNFLTSDAMTAFNHLWLAFTKAPILEYFDPEYHI